MSIRPINCNPFITFSAQEIAQMIATYKQAVIDVATTGKSYVVPGRTFQAEDLDSLKDTLSELSAAQAYQNGTKVTRAYPVTARVRG